MMYHTKGEKSLGLPDDRNGTDFFQNDSSNQVGITVRSFVSLDDSTKIQFFQRQKHVFRDIIRDGLQNLIRDRTEMKR